MSSRIVVADHDVGFSVPVAGTDADSRPRFHHQRPQGRTSRLRHYIDVLGTLIVLLYIAAFGFYLFTRSTTDSVAGTLVAYQIAMLSAEGFVFLSGLVFGLWQVSPLPWLL